jgi:outer membrane protein
MFKTVRCLLLLGLYISSPSSQAYDLITDPFGTLGEVSATPAKNVLATPCQLTVSPPSPLTLLNAVERVLCHNPQTRVAWANVKAQAAAVGTGWSAYLPTINARGSANKAAKSSTFPGHSGYSTDVSPVELEGTLNLNWVLYDFGLRAANLESARQLLNAANASQDDVLQIAFLNTAQAFYEAQAAQALLSANRESEQVAEKSFNAAEAKYAAGIGTVADKLQAQTAYAQAVSKRVQAEGDVQSTMGSLSILMGQRPDIALNITVITEDTAAEPLFQQAVEDLIEQAVRNHPKILAARAQVKATQAKKEGISAAGRPTLSLTASEDYFHTDATPINNQGTSNQTVNSQRIGLQVDVPLFEGFGRHYKESEAEAQIESKQAELANTEQQVALDVWKNYQAVRTEAENLKASKTLIISAAQSFEVAQGRYKSGVGSILELLKAQSDLASAYQQKLLAITRWQTVRVKLATSLGQLDL